MRKLKAKEPTRWMAIADSHGEFVDKEAEEIAYGFMDEFQPSIRVHLGDIFDFRWLRQNASRTDCESDPEQDIEMGCDLLRWYKPTHILRGNHDQRLYDRLPGGRYEIKSGPELAQVREYVTEISEAEGDAKVRPYEKNTGIFRIGGLRITHGNKAGLNAIRDLTRIYGDCLVGHIHAIERVPVPRFTGGRSYAVGRCIGCLCQVDLDYNRAQTTTMRQQNGFAFGWVEPGGTTIVRQAEKTGKHWEIPW